MATFVYEALNAAGKPQKGTVDAGTSEEAIQRIKSQGFFPTAVREQKVKKSAVAGEAVTKKTKNIPVSVGGGGEGGSALSEAMSKHPKAFDRLYSKMVNDGEIGGVLDII